MVTYPSCFILPFRMPYPLCCWIFKFWHKQTQNAWTHQRKTWETFTTSPFLLERNHNDTLCAVLARSVLAQACTLVLTRWGSQSGSLNELSRVSIGLMDRGGEAMSGGQEEHAPAPLCFSERHRKIMTTFSHQRFQLGSMAASGSWWVAWFISLLCVFFFKFLSVSCSPLSYCREEQWRRGTPDLTSGPFWWSAEPRANLFCAWTLHTKTPQSSGQVLSVLESERIFFFFNVP